MVSMVKPISSFCVDNDVWCGGFQGVFFGPFLEVELPLGLVLFEPKSVVHIVIHALERADDVQNSQFRAGSGGDVEGKIEGPARGFGEVGGDEYFFHKKGLKGCFEM